MRSHHDRMGGFLGLFTLILQSVMSWGFRLKRSSATKHSLEIKTLQARPGLRSRRPALATPARRGARRFPCPDPPRGWRRSSPFPLPTLPGGCLAGPGQPIVTATLFLAGSVPRCMRKAIQGRTSEENDCANDFIGTSSQRRHAGRTWCGSLPEEDR